MFKGLVVLLAVIAMSGGAAHAEVLAEGAVKNGYYWQKIQKSNGGIQYLCRSTSSGKINKKSSCENAGAVQP